MTEAAALDAELATPVSLETVATPALILDVTKVDRNIARLRAHLAKLGTGFRPHVKTSKSIEVARRLFPEGTGPITVSTLAEAEYFAEGGFDDITYAVGLSLDRIARARKLVTKGVRLSVLIDTLEQARALVAAAGDGGPMPAVLIEIDCDGHRGGVLPDDPDLVAIADVLRNGRVELAGVLTHAGESYNARGGAGLPEAAEGERAAAVAAAEMLRAAGHASPVVSVGSTPTAHFAQDLTGVTEVRAGVFTFFDLVMAGIGVCTFDDIALSVLTTVIGRQPVQQRIFIDAGGLALSKDRSTAGHAFDAGYGLVCDEDGRVLDGLVVSAASQELGTVTSRDGRPLDMAAFPVGRRLRILPNHSCFTAAAHPRYHVVDGGPEVAAVWERVNGW